MKRKHLRVGGELRALLGAVLILVAVGAILEAKDKGEKDFKAAEVAALKQDWDKALPLYMSAADKNPKNMAYQIGMRRARFEAGQMHIGRGDKLRAAGKIEEAMGEFQKAMIADPSSTIAIQEVRRMQEILNANKSGKPVNPNEASLTPAERERREEDLKIDSMEAPPELQPAIQTIPPIKINNQPAKVMYETIGKMAGVNVVFDPQFTAPSRNSNFDIATNTPVEEVFDYLALLTHTFWKPLSSNTIFVAEDNVTKRRDYEDQVAKVFYVTNVTSPQEFQEVATAVRTVTEMRRVFTSNAQKAIVVRGTADQVALCEKLIRDLDRPKPEVVVDVNVMQINSNFSRSLGMALSNASGTAGLQSAITFLPQTTPASTSSTSGSTTPASTSSGTIGLGGPVSINQFQTSLPSAIVNAVMSDSKTKTLNHPQVRTSDGMKVELVIGQRIPYATGSFSSGVSVSSSVSPLVSTQFNYADVGLKLSITPQIHSANEVTLHIEVEVSEVDQDVLIGGISQPVIGQSKNTADIRLKDGEVNLLTSLSQASDQNTVGGLPGLTSIPILGQFLFGNATKTKTAGELMIALTPHIIRPPEYTAENLRGIYAGADQVIKLNYAPKPEEAPAPAAPVANQAAAPATQNPPATAPQIPATVPVPPAAPRPPGAPPATASPGKAAVKFAPASIEAKVGAPVVVSIQVDNVNDLFSASPIRIKYDPALLKMNDAEPGEMFTRDGVRITSVKDIRNEVGEAMVTIARTPGTKGVSGAGAVLTLNFTAIGKGSGTITVPEFTLKNSQVQPIAATPGEVTVKVD